MKKIIALSLVTIMVSTTLIGCDSNKKKTTSEDIPVTAVNENDDKDIVENTDDVKVNIPGSMVGTDADGNELNVESVRENALEEGITSVEKHDDGSYIFTIPKEKHEVMISEMEAEINDGMKNLREDEDFASYQDITANNDYTEFDAIVIKDGFEEGFSSFILMGVAFSATTYQIFNGVSADDLKVTFDIIDADTNEVFDTVSFPEDIGFSGEIEDEAEVNIDFEFDEDGIIEDESTDGVVIIE